MAVKTATVAVTELSILQENLNTASLDLAYQRSCSHVQAIIRDEDVRKLNFRLLAVEDEADNLEAQLTEAEKERNALQDELNLAHVREQAMEDQMKALSIHANVKDREKEAMTAEISTFESLRLDSDKTLREKLALQSEVARMKPELDHLRNEASTYQQSLSEKLALQREVSTLQVELENAHRSADRVKTKVGRSKDNDAEREAQLDELQSQLGEAQKALREARREAERVRTELGAAKNATSDDADSEALAQMEELRKELVTERKERQRVEKTAEKERQEWQAERKLRDEKLADFRNKLRSTKEERATFKAQAEKLQEDLDEAQSKVHAAPTKVTKKGNNKPSLKRDAVQMDLDAEIGTPGDGAVVAKKGKRPVPVSAPGDKSTFSITPFLNRTLSVAPDSPQSDVQPAPAIVMSDTEQEEDDDIMPSIEAIDPPNMDVDASPLIAKALSVKPKPAPLAVSSSTKQNTNLSAGNRKKPSIVKPVLPQVAEETDENAPTTISNNPQPQPKLKTKTKVPAPRKSLTDFTSFIADSTTVVKKKRKLLGVSSTASLAGGKTIFDDDEAEPTVTKPKPIPGRGLFAARSMAARSNGLFGGVAKAAIMGVGGSEGVGGGFSPLKRDRRAAKVA